MLPDAVMDPDALEELLGDSFASRGGMSVDEVTSSGVVMRLAVGDHHGRPGGTVSGPTMMTLADTVAWLAILSRIGPVVLAVTTSLHIDFLRKPEISDLVATGDLLKLGSRLAVVDVTIRSAGRTEPVAKAQVTYSIPPRPRG